MEQMEFDLIYRRGSFQLTEKFGSLLNAIERANYLWVRRAGELFEIRQDGKLLIGETPVECLAGDLKYEHDNQRPLLVEAIQLCETQQDYVSRELLEDLLEHCEEASDWLETQHSLISEVGSANYLQSHIGSSD